MALSEVSTDSLEATRSGSRRRSGSPGACHATWPCFSPRCHLHDHHVTFRSAGGSHALANRITLCAFRHQRCVHAGLLRIRGRAPDSLVFELGLRPGTAPLARYRSGDVALPALPALPASQPGPPWCRATGDTPKAA